MSQFADEKTDRLIPWLLHIKTSIHVSSEHVPRRPASLQSFTKNSLIQAISCLNFTWLLSKGNFAWCIFCMKPSAKPTFSARMPLSVDLYAYLKAEDSWAYTPELLKSLKKTFDPFEVGGKWIWNEVLEQPLLCSHRHLLLSCDLGVKPVGTVKDAEEATRTKMDAAWTRVGDSLRARQKIGPLQRSYRSSISREIISTASTPYDSNGGGPLERWWPQTPKDSRCWGRRNYSPFSASFPAVLHSSLSTAPFCRLLQR